MANDAEIMLKMASRLGTARAEAVALLEAAADHAGVWMHNLSTGARAFVTHEDTLVRLLTEGWVHLAPEPSTPVQPPMPSPEPAVPPAAAEPPQAAPAAEVEIEVAPEEPAVPDAPDAPTPRGKKA